MELHLSTKIVINFLNPKNISVTFTNLQIYSYDLNWWRRDRWPNTNLSSHRLTAKLVLSRRERHPSPPPLFLYGWNSEKWPCDVGVIKLHLQSTPHYNTAARWRGYPFEISSEKAANDWRRRRHREKIAFAAAKGEKRRCGLPRRAEQSLMISLVFAHQFKPCRSFYQPSYRVFQTIVANYSHCM